jgi:hypothetical protein
MNINKLSDRDKKMILARLAAAIALTILTGCVTTHNEDNNNGPGGPKRTLSACDTSKYICVDVIFADIPDGSRGTNTCPVYTEVGGVLNKEANISLDSRKKIRWRSADIERNVIDTIEFSVFFDPFVGKSYSGKEKIDSKVLASGPNKPPAGVVFKYTITVDDCDPLDPMIRIN